MKNLVKSNNSQKRKNVVGTRITIVIMVLFFASLAVLTLTAGAIHDAQLPKVKASRLTVKEFEITNVTKDGNSVTRTRSETALPEGAYHDGSIYIITQSEKYGREYYYAHKTEVTLLADSVQNGYYPIQSKLQKNIRVILESSEELRDGMEVCIITDKKK